EHQRAVGAQELAVTLQLEESQPADALDGVERAGALGVEEAIARAADVAVGERADVAIARAPRIADERRRLAREQRGGAIAHEVEGAAQRGAPRLRPPRPARPSAAHTRPPP